MLTSFYCSSSCIRITERGETNSSVQRNNRAGDSHQPGHSSLQMALTRCPLPQKLKPTEAHGRRPLAAAGRGLAHRHRNQKPLTPNPKFEHQNTKKNQIPSAPLRSTRCSLSRHSNLRNYLWASQLSRQSAPFSQEASCIWSGTRRPALGRKRGQLGEGVVAARAGWWR